MNQTVKQGIRDQTRGCQETPIARIGVFTVKNISWWQAIVILLSMGTMVIVFFGILGLPLHIPLLFQIFITAGLAYRNGYRWQQIEKMLLAGFSSTAPIVIILLLIGGLIGLWIASGTIPTIIYYGLNLINPRLFYVVSFLICSLVSFAMGTGIGTLSTVGLALFSIGVSLALPLPIVAGAIVSGSYFGDRFSPLSAVANFTAHTTQVPMRELLMKMLTTTIPAFVITLVAYYLLGRGLDSQPISGDAAILELIEASFPVSLFSVLPPIIIIVAAFLRVPTIANLSIGLVISLFTGIALAPGKAINILSSIYYGPVLNTGQDTFNALFSRGGMIDLLDLIALLILAAILAGMLDKMGVFVLLLERLITKATRLPNLVAITAASGILMAMVGCNQLLAILLPGKTFLTPFAKVGEKPLLARTLADSGLIFSPLIPWNINALMVVGVLGVDVLELAPYAVMNWVLPILTIVVSFLAKPTSLTERDQALESGV